MKKTFKLLSTLLLSAFVLSFASCNLWKEIQGPENEWEEYDYTYSAGSSELELNCYVMFSSTDTTVEKGLGTKKETITLPAGLNVLIRPAADSDSTVIEAILGEFDIDRNYILKSFKLDAEEEIESDEEESSKKTIKMTKTKWTILYNSVSWSSKKSKDPDTILKSYTEFTKLPEDFSWENVLKTILIAKLLD